MTFPRRFTASITAAQREGIDAGKIKTALLFPRGEAPRVNDHLFFEVQGRQVYPQGIPIAWTSSVQFQKTRMSLGDERRLVPASTAECAPGQLTDTEIAKLMGHEDGYAALVHSLVRVGYSLPADGHLVSWGKAPSPQDISPEEELNYILRIVWKWPGTATTIEAFSSAEEAFKRMERITTQALATSVNAYEVKPVKLTKGFYIQIEPLS